MNDTSPTENDQTPDNQTPDGEVWTREQQVFYPSAGPGSAFFSHATIGVIVFLWLLGWIPGGIAATALFGDPGETPEPAVPIGGLIVVGWGVVWTCLYLYYVATRLRRKDNGTTVTITPVGLVAIDHLGIQVVQRWDEVTSIGLTRLPGAGTGLAKATKPFIQADQPATKVGAADGLIGWAQQRVPERLPKAARKLFTSQPYDPDRQLGQIGIAFGMAGRVDDANEIITAARTYRPDLFADLLVREAR